MRVMKNVGGTWGLADCCVSSTHTKSSQEHCNVDRQGTMQADKCMGKGEQHIKMIFARSSQFVLAKNRKGADGPEVSKSCCFQSWKSQEGTDSQNFKLFTAKQGRPAKRARRGRVRVPVRLGMWSGCMSKARSKASCRDVHRDSGGGSGRREPV